LQTVIFCLLALFLLTAMSTAQCTAPATMSVTTWHNDNCRTGWQQSETQLTPQSVLGNFGLLWRWGSPKNPLAGNVYAQPLAVTLPQSVGNCQNPCSLVIVATEQAMLYAFNASSSSQTPVWSTNLAQTAGGLVVDCNSSPGSSWSLCQPDPQGHLLLGRYVGVTGTPVIDMETTPYTLFVAAAVEIPSFSSGYAIEYLLFAVDITTGNVKAQTGIGGSVPGQGTQSYCSTTSGTGMLAFDVNHIQRSGLLLLPNGVVYVPFADLPEYENGWLFGYSLSGSSLSQTAIFTGTPHGTGGGIWGSGAGPAFDGTYIYVATGNGTFDVPSGEPDYGDSLLKLDPSTLAIKDYYTPYDVFNYPVPSGHGLCPNDEDFGSGGVLLPPDFKYYGGSACSGGCSVVINADKQSNLYVADQRNLGGFSSGTVCAGGLNNIECITTPPIPSNDPGRATGAAPPTGSTQAEARRTICSIMCRQRRTSVSASRPRRLTDTS